MSRHETQYIIPLSAAFPPSMVAKFMLETHIRDAAKLEVYMKVKGVLNNGTRFENPKGVF